MWCLVKAKLRKMQQWHNKATKSEAKEVQGEAEKCGGNAKRTEQSKGEAKQSLAKAWLGMVTYREGNARMS